MIDGALKDRIMIKNITELKKELLRREGGKKEVNAAQMGEILSILSDMIFDDGSAILILHKNGKRRAKAKK